MYACHVEIIPEVALKFEGMFFSGTGSSGSEIC
jgi:hypothetical protein